MVVSRTVLRPVPVVMVKVAQGPVAADVMGTGTLEARVSAVVSAKISGRIAELKADQNDSVHAGQLLVRLDDAELRQQLETSKANLAATRASVERAKADEARAVASARQAKLDYDRVADLLQTKVESQSAFDKASAQWHTAEADVSRARAVMVEIDKQVIAAERILDTQQERLNDADIKSPFAGIITRREREMGDIVVPGAPIFRLIATNEIWVSAYVDETAMDGLAIGQPARIVFRAQPDAAYSGEVARLAKEVDRETREFLVEVRTKQLPTNWAVGQRAEVFIQTASRLNAHVVPRHAIAWRAKMAGVFVAKNGRARWREVGIGVSGREQVEVVSGLQPGEQVVMPQAGSRKPLEDGQRIKVP